MVIIGLSGTNGSGKDTIAHVLAESFGFLHADATKMLGDQLTKRGLSHERENKANLSAEWRREYGMSAIVDKAVQLFDKNTHKGLVVGSLRHPGEADKVHELGGTVIWVDADPRVRFDRISANDRGRIEDKKTFEQFIAEEEREMHPVGDAATLNMSAVKERADVIIENNGSDIEAFKQEVTERLQSILA